MIDDHWHVSAGGILSPILATDFTFVTLSVTRGPPQKVSRKKLRAAASWRFGGGFGGGCTCGRPGCASNGFGSIFARAMGYGGGYGYSSEEDNGSEDDYY